MNPLRISHKASKLINSVLFILLFTLPCEFLTAAHIVGGDVTYDCLEVDSLGMRSHFLFEFTLYRDSESNGAGFDNGAKFGIYRQLANGTWEIHQLIENINFEDRQTVEIPPNPCVEVPDNIGVESAVYRFDAWIDWSQNNYMVAYQRCCRNNTIANVFNPGETGAAFTIEIYPEAQSSCNNSPKFEEFPPILVCRGIDIGFDHSALDDEGDGIVYSFCAPLASGGTDGSNGGDATSCTGVRPAPEDCWPPYDEVQFRPPFFATAPLAGGPVVSINSVSGLISGIPDLLGQFVVGVCATEYRDGEIIGVVRRDFQFNVVQCLQLVNAAIQNDAVVQDEYIVNSCGLTTIPMSNLSTEVSNIETYHWIMDTGGLNPEEAFTRDATFEFPGIGEYFGQMIVNEFIDQCADTAFIHVVIYPSIDADFDFEYDTCVASAVEFFDSTVTGAIQVDAWEWDFNGEGVDFKQNPAHQFKIPGTKSIGLIAEDNNGCRDTIYKDIDWFPAPPILIIEPDNFVGCTPGEIFFNNLSSPIDSTYDILWDFGDGTTGSEISPMHTYEDPGVYSVSLDVVSPIGCQKDIRFPNWITIESAPEASFTCSSAEVNNFDSTIDFFDQSTGAVTYQWDFDGVGTSTDRNPSFTFPDTGMYNVKLTVIHQSGCPDVYEKLIDVKPLNTFFLPNAFTPNNDGRNDTFLGKGFVDGILEFELAVWNRWGEQLFITEDPREAWNGTANNSGQPAPQGVYTYTLRMVGPRGELEESNGSVTLLR